MKVEELMVGDYVIVDHPCKQPTIERVYEVGNIGIKIKSKSKTWVNFVSCNRVSEVPLSEEILLKSGFLKIKEGLSENKDYSYYYLNTTDDNLCALYIKHLRKNVFIIRAETFYYIKSTGKEYSRIFTGEVWWVHELQHIFRILNIEKEVIL